MLTDTGVVWITCDILSAVWTLILTAPIHCRASIAETVMQRHISPNLSANWVNYSLNTSTPQINTHLESVFPHSADVSLTEGYDNETVVFQSVNHLNTQRLLVRKKTNVPRKSVLKTNQLFHACSRQNSRSQTTIDFFSRQNHHALDHRAVGIRYKTCRIQSSSIFYEIQYVFNFRLITWHILGSLNH